MSPIWIGGTYISVSLYFTIYTAVTLENKILESNMDTLLDASLRHFQNNIPHLFIQTRQGSKIKIQAWGGCLFRVYFVFNVNARNDNSYEMTTVMIWQSLTDQCSIT